MTITEWLGTKTQRVRLGLVGWLVINRSSFVDAAGRQSVPGHHPGQSAKRDLISNQNDVVKLGKKRGAPFEYQQEVAEKCGELKRLENELHSESNGATGASLQNIPSLYLVTNDEGKVEDALDRLECLLNPPAHTVKLAKFLGRVALRVLPKVSGFIFTLKSRASP